MTIIWATIIVLGVLITIHELGHFIAARSVGIRVEKFSIGAPPRFFSIISKDNGWSIRIFFYKRTNGKFIWQPVYEKFFNKNGRTGSETEYVLALFPLGGYVKMAGIIDENMDTELKYEDDEFMSKPLWAKLWVLSAGVIMNTILAFFIFASLALYNGSPEIKNPPVITELQENMPAVQAGLQIGDRILSINENNIETWDDLTANINPYPNTDISLIVLRNNIEIMMDITTAELAVPLRDGIDTIGMIGIVPELIYNDISIREALNIGVARTISGFAMIIMSLKMLGSGAASMSDLGGPIMIAQLAGETAEAGWIPFLTFMALISINLAFLNILPIPGLDGGHIFIHLIEGIIRKPLSLKARIIIQQIGMTFLLLLMVTVIFNDITRLFN